MPTYKAKGLVIKSYRLGEADKIIKLFTPDFGLISAVAKGAFNIKSRFGGRLELYNVIDCELSKGRTLDIISQAEIIEVFENISGDLLKFNYAQVISEMILKTQAESTTSYNLFKLVYLVIKRINNDKISNEIMIQTLVAFFVVNFSKIMGYAPMLRNCTICGKPIKDVKAKLGMSSIGDIDNHEAGTIKMKQNQDICTFFSINHGGVVCQKCSEGKSGIFDLNIYESNFLNEIFYCKMENIPEVMIDAKVSSKLLDILTEYVAFHSEIYLGSLDYLKKMKKNIV